MSSSGSFNLASNVLLWNESTGIFHLLCFSSVQSSKILCVSCEVERRPCPRLQYYFLADPPFCLHPLPSLISSYLNHDIPDVQAGFRKGRGTRDQIANIYWIIKTAKEFQKNIYFCFIDYAKAFDCVDHNKLWKILKEMGIPDHLTS